MAKTPTSNLTSLVEQRLLSLIKSQEASAFQNMRPISADNYLKLADLYHFHKSFHKEHQILSRFANFPLAKKEQLQDIYERVECLDKTIHRLANSESPHIALSSDDSSEQEANALALLALESDPEIVELHSRAEVNLTHLSNGTAKKQDKIKFLTICAAYTGKKESDEIVQLSIVLSEYAAKEKVQFKILQTYTGTRKPSKNRGKRVHSKFNIGPDEYKRAPFSNAKIISLFKQADYVISHNNADIERSLLVTAIPELINAQWYSTQKDIPWRALGYESIGLSDLVSELGRRKPRSTLERAKAIYFLLQSCEPSGGNLFFERIRNMKPMKALVVTERMKSAQKSMQPRVFYLKITIAIIILSGLSGWVVFKYFPQFWLF